MCSQHRDRERRTVRCEDPHRESTPRPRRIGLNNVPPLPIWHWELACTPPEKCSSQNAEKSSPNVPPLPTLALRCPSRTHRPASTISDAPNSPRSPPAALPLACTAAQSRLLSAEIPRNIPLRPRLRQRVHLFFQESRRPPPSPVRRR